jgi:glycosyltransferase involved in cell wall biosynthesis
MLVRFFATYKERRPGPLALVLVGQVGDLEPEHPDVFLTGMADEATKWGLLRGASVFVSPSPLESFSLVLLEGWSAGAPALVNALCEPTREHARRSGGGLWFDGYPSFEAALDRLLADDALRASLAEQGRHYVDTHFRWPAIVERYRRFTDRVRASA